MYSWRVEAKTTDGATAVYSPENPPPFRAEVVENDGWSKLVIAGVPEDMTVTKIVYPAIAVPMTDGTKVLTTESQGLLISDIASHDKFTFKPDNPDYVFETRFRSMKFGAILSPNIFIAIKDDRFFPQYGDIYRSPDRKTLHFDVITHSDEMPFEVKLLPFEGGWYEAAVLYKQFKRKASALRKNSRMRDIGFWLWNRDQISNVVPPTLQLAQDSGVPVALDWYWYHKNPYDTGYPDYCPPREGFEAFTKAIAELKQAGVFTQVYTNGFLWDMENADWKDGGEECAVRNEKGEIVSTAFNVFLNHEMAYMCGTGKKFQAKLLSEIEKLADCGLDGIYIDMIGCATMEKCYNPAHPHRPGAGSYMAEGYREMLSELHRRRPELYLSTEDCNERYMDVVDSVISVMSVSGERYGFVPPFEYVPAFSVAHHGEQTMYGASAHIDGIPPYDSMWPQDGRWKHEPDWNAIAPEQFFVELGRGVIWGQQPMAANLRPEHLADQKLASRYKFICDTARFYFENRDWLYDGEMLAPPPVECAATSVAFVSRYIFTKEGTYKLARRVMPVLLSSAWRAPDGRKALFLLNYTDSPHKFVCGKIKGEVEPHSFQRFDLD
ncbi:MAG: DUF6259 domain-containing protein [Victivallaceae bacterium]|nr:DUF6259 domain-containing protein [Victivallaceae bacterium]